jgi:hypothetical protein
MQGQLPLHSINRPQDSNPQGGSTTSQSIRWARTCTRPHKNKGSWRRRDGGREADDINPPPINVARLPSTRHCEEAVRPTWQSSCAASAAQKSHTPRRRSALDCFVASAPRNDEAQWKLSDLTMSRNSLKVMVAVDSVKSHKANRCGVVVVYRLVGMRKNV